MESQPQNPEFRINPENFHPCLLKVYSKTCVKRPLINRQNKGLDDNW